jgi:hypothetical protein
MEPGRAREGAVSALAADGAHVVAFEVYGSRASVSVPHAELVPRVVDQFPVDATPCTPGPDDRRFALEIEEDGSFALLQDGTVMQRPPAIEGALTALRGRLFRHAIEHARDRLAVHAGVVGSGGRAIVLPGPAMVGKTTLVLELVKAGATYYTDDFALFDREGMVYPYHSLLYIKGEDKLNIDSVGGVRGHEPLPVGVIASVTFTDGVEWNPRPWTRGEAMLKLIRHAYGMDAPEIAMEAARNAAACAVVLEAERGEAAEAAAALLEIASQAAAQPPPGGSP